MNTVCPPPVDSSRANIHNTAILALGGQAAAQNKRHGRIYVDGSSQELREITVDIVFTAPALLIKTSTPPETSVNSIRVVAIALTGLLQVARPGPMLVPEAQFYFDFIEALGSENRHSRCFQAFTGDCGPTPDAAPVIKMRCPVAISVVPWLMTSA